MHNIVYKLYNNRYIITVVCIYIYVCVCVYNCRAENFKSYTNREKWSCTLTIYY